MDALPDAPLIAESPEVFYSGEPVTVVTPGLIARLKAQAWSTPRKRSRLCVHESVSAAVHEMIIVHHRDVYVRPHRHTRKSESFHCIEGDVRIVLFDDCGNIERLIDVDGSAGGPFFVRIPPAVFHTLLIRSEWLVFHETTAGPFDGAQLETAPWSPLDTDVAGIAAFRARLDCGAAAFRGAGYRAGTP